MVASIISGFEHFFFVKPLTSDGVLWFRWKVGTSWLKKGLKMPAAAIFALSSSLQALPAKLISAVENAYL
eukprot:scaffold229665_cov22-Tisochrysis_lutea.AAC.1